MYQNINPASRTSVPLLLDIQSGLLDELDTRVVVPLYASHALPSRRLRTLTPLFDIDGEQYLMMTPQLAGIQRSLLADFREVEQNFRDLDREVRERIATWEGGKGELLGEIFGERDAIADSDQGRSFRAFWEFLMSPSRQEELSELLHKAFALPPVQSLEPDRRLLRMHYDWLEAGEVAQRTVARLSEQLRRYLDDQAWLENKRIMHLLRGIESRALALRGQPPDRDITVLDDARIELNLPLDRPLYSPPLKPRIDEQILVEGTADHEAEALFNQIHVDKARLLANLRLGLRQQPQISLGDLLQGYPLEQGLAEFDASSGDARLILSRDQLVELLRLFLPESSNEARLIDRIDSHIAKVVELGFLRKLRGQQEPLYEVRRILKAFIDAQWLNEFDQRLAEYAAQLGGEGEKQ